jgi:uncharacterized protein (TIGR02453 family)
MAKSAYFSSDLFRFLTELKAHNNRPWFEENKARYETELKDPMLRFISDLGPRLAKISRYFPADPRPVGGSMMRIYRDVRFAKDKSPYKTAMAAHFEHSKGKEGMTPAFYLHLAPKDCVVGAGIWRPEPKALAKIRDAIVADPKRWQKAVSERERSSACGMAGESLARPPKGYDPEHPCIADLKRKDFAVSITLPDADIASSRCMETVLDGFKRASPFQSFIADALGLPY